MTVAELAKRFERGCAAASSETPGRAPAAGRVRELTRRLEKAVGNSAQGSNSVSRPLESNSPNPVTSPSRVEKPIQESPRSALPAKRDLFNATKTQPTTAPAPISSPSPLPRISHNFPNTDTLSSSNRPRVSPSPRVCLSTTVPSVEKLSSIPKTDESKIIDAKPNSEEDTTTQLSVLQRLALFEQLCTTQDPTPIPNPIRSPPTPSTGFSSNSSAKSSQRHGPFDLIPDISEGDLDDIEGVERVDDEPSVNSSADDDDNATFRRAKTVQSFSSASSQSSYHSGEPAANEPVVSDPTRSEPADPPSIPSTPSNASENSSFSTADFASAPEELEDHPADRPTPHTLAVPPRTAPKRDSNLSAATEEFREYSADRPVPHTLAVPPRMAARHDSNLSTQSYTLQIAPGSFKNLPKAKVMIARRKGQEDDKDEPGASNDNVCTKKLIREYENPKELMKGSVSLVELDDDEEEKIEFRDPDVSDIQRQPSMVRRKNRVEAFRHRYDEFMDPQEIEQVNKVAEGSNASSSKERYQRKRRLFRRGKVEKVRQREERLARQREAVARRSTVISGAIDRVSLAADPWIDFITDTNTIPVTTKTGGGIRRGLKKLFGFGRQNQNAGLIKTGK